eukprot:jgi/Psemu1/49688/gm1.49688_g
MLRTYTAQPSNGAESDGSSDINKNDSDSDSNSDSNSNSNSDSNSDSDSDSDSDRSSKNSPEQPRRNLVSASNSSPRIPKTRTPILCYPEEGSYKTIKPIMYEAWLSEEQIGVFIRSLKQQFFLTEDIDRLCMDMKASKKEGRMVPQCQKMYKNFEVYRTRIKADGRPTSVCYYKFPDGITCTSQFFNGAKDSVSSSLKLKQHFGVSHTEFSRSNQQVLPFVRYKMAVKRSIVDIQVEASVDEDIEDCIEQWALSQRKREEAELARLDKRQRDEAKLAQAQADKRQREEAKAAEREIAQHQKEHGCEDERWTAWVKEAKKRSEDAEFRRIQQEKKQSKLDQYKLKSKGFELAEHSERDGKNKRSLKVKESQIKAEVTIYLDGVNVSMIPVGDSIDVRVKAVSIFQFDERERDEDIDVYVDGQAAYNCPAVFGKNEYEDYTVPNQDDHDHVSHLVSAICHQIPIAEYPPMPPPTHLRQLQSPVPHLHLQSPKGADFPANN